MRAHGSRPVSTLSAAQSTCGTAAVTGTRAGRLCLVRVAAAPVVGVDDLAEGVLASASTISR
jgi:hypothetical protein